MTTISSELRVKIERRAKRAWRRREDGSKSPVTRISDVDDHSLKYRLPNTPDYYGQEKVLVVFNNDGSLTIDPKTTGLIDCLVDADLSRLKKHGDQIRAYYLSKDSLKVGDDVHGIELISRAKVVDKSRSGVRAFIVETSANDVVSHNGDSFRASKGNVVDELDAVKDLGFTTGDVDCIGVSDVNRLRKHVGKVRAYKYTDTNAQSPTKSPKITYKVGELIEVKDANADESNDCAAGINVASRSWITTNATGSIRCFAVEFESTDIAAVPTGNAGKFRVFKCKVVEELDPKTFAPLAPIIPVAPTPAVIVPTDLVVQPTTPVDPTSPVIQDPIDQTDQATPPKSKKGFFERLFGSSDNN